MYGDVDGDGDVDQDDVMLLRKYIVHAVELDERAKLAADINEDGEPDIGDVIGIRHYLINGVWDLPVPEYDPSANDNKETEEQSADDLSLHISYNSYNNEYAEITLNTNYADADIYYTTDGEKATVHSNIYSGTFYVYDDTTINAIAVYGYGFAEIQNFDVFFKEGANDGEAWSEETEYEDLDKEDYEDEFYNVSDLSEFDCIVSEWAEDEVYQAYEYGLIPEEMLDEDLTQKISRDRFAALAIKLYEGLNNKETETIPITQTTFIDCYDRSNDKYNSYIGAAYLLGITDGITDYEFCPDMFINREQLATMLCRAIKKVYFDGWTLKNDSYYELDTQGAELFNDDYLISDYAKSSVYFLSKHDIIKGVEDGVFNPCPTNDWDDTGTATKEQAIVMALRAFDAGYTLSPDYEEFDEDMADDEFMITESAYYEDEPEEEIIYEPSEDALKGGYCGTNVVWELHENKVLVIKGANKINNMASAGTAPWSKETINKIVIEKGVKGIGRFAFAGLENLKEVELPSTLNIIDAYAFSNCVSLTNINLPGGIKTIGNNAFYKCSNLEYINISYGVNDIATEAFSGCENLSEIIIPSTVTRIDEGAFYKCKKLEDITIPQSVTFIGKGSFDGCTELKNIYYLGDRETWDRISQNSGYSKIQTKVYYN